MKLKHLPLFTLTLSLMVGTVVLTGCGGDDDGTVVVVPPVFVTSYDEVFGWTCDSGETCQDVYRIEFAAGTVVDISAIEVTGGSVLQMALYAPGVGLGGLNLFTGTNDELLCNYVASCLDNTAGQVATGLVIGDAGIHRLAITRDWDKSCGASGDYRLIVTGDVEFSTPVLAEQDVVSKATGVACP